MYRQRVPDAISFICKGFKTTCCCFGLWYYSSTGVSEIIWGDFNIEHYLDVDWCHLVDRFINFYGQSSGSLDFQHAHTTFRQ